MDWMEGSDAAIVQQVRSGEPDAFGVLVERHSRSLFRLAYRMTGNESDAEDVVQEAFLRAYRQLRRFEARSSFGTWIYRIGVNCALDLMRSRQRHPEHPLETPADDERPARTELPSSGPSPDRVVFGVQVQERVAAAMHRLTPAERVAFVLRHYEGYSSEEIGRALGVRGNTAKNTLFRAVQKLREALQPMVDSKA
ncbi:MAG TPA: sigma-70 family RNA polymerase sigma factor [Candidatus Acidoferrales bacterium]